VRAQIGFWDEKSKDRSGQSSDGQGSNKANSSSDAHDPHSLDTFFVSNTHNGSNLEISPSKNCSFWQKNGGFAPKKSHFFSSFFTFLWFFLLQPVAGQPQALTGTLQKKSCLKAYGRFFVFSGS